MPEFPIPARWVTLKEFPIDLLKSDGTVYRDYEQDGWIWQAEEVRKGDHWERFYGFVRPQAIVRLPAVEIELRNALRQHLGTVCRAGWMPSSRRPIRASTVMSRAGRSSWPSGSAIVVESRTRRRRSSSAEAMMA